MNRTHSASLMGLINGPVGPETEESRRLSDIADKAWEDTALEFLGVAESSAPTLAGIRRSGDAQ